MEERSTGLILRARPLTESSLVINWLSEDLGRISTVAKGARRPKSSFRGKLDLFHLAEFSFIRSKRSDLHTLKEVRLLRAFEGLRRDIDKLQQTAYAATFIERATETETPLDNLYELMLFFVEHADRSDWRAELVLWFELMLLEALGMQPDVSQATLSPRTRKLVTNLYSADSLNPAVFQPDAGETKELIRFLHGFIIYHFDRIPKGRRAALQHEA